MLVGLALVGCDDPQGGADDPMEEPDEMGDEEEPDYGPPDTQYVEMGQEGGLLQSVHFETNIGMCTGILLNERTLLTAAHCVGPVQNLDTAWSSVTAPTLKAMGKAHGSTLTFGRIWVHDDRYRSVQDPGTAAVDVAIVELAAPIYIVDDALALPNNAGLGFQYPTIADAPPVFPASGEGVGMWMNGRRLDGEETPFGMAYRGTSILPAQGEITPYHWLEAGDTLGTPGDSGGPLFREYAGETNDGIGGIAGVKIYGLTSRVGHYARVDTVKSWIDTRAEYIRTVQDHHWVTCQRASCQISMTHNLDHDWEALGEVPQGTRLGVFAADGDKLVVSYPMADRDHRVQVVDFGSGDFGYLYALHGAPPAEDLRAGSRYCHASQCDVVYKRNLADPDVTALGTVPCGTQMGVFVETDDWAVVSYPMDDRDRAVQVVPNDGSGGWSATPPNPMTCG